MTKLEGNSMNCKKNLIACKECLSGRYLSVWYWNNQCNNPGRDDVRFQVQMVNSMKVGLMDKEANRLINELESVSIANTMVRPQENH